MNMSIKDKAALGRANTKKEQNEIKEALLGETLLRKLRKELKNTSAKNPHKKETLRDKIRDLKANLPKNNKNNIAKRFKGGLMVKPKTAKRGY